MTSGPSPPLPPPPPLDIEEEYLTSNGQVYDQFKRFFHLKTNGHFQIYLHSNGMCILSLGPTHPIIKDNLDVKYVTFLDQRLSNKVSGKRKRGAQSLRKDSHLCSVKTSCGKTFQIQTSMDGKLVEINRELKTNPKSIKEPTKGFIVIMNTNWVNLKEDVNPDPLTWIPEKEFLSSMSKKGSIINPDNSELDKDSPDSDKQDKQE